MGNVRGTGSQPRLVGGAVEHGGRVEATTNVEGADSLGGVHLVAREAEQVDTKFPGTHGDSTGRLDGIAVNEDSRLAAEVGDLPHRLNGTDLVIGVNYADEFRIRAQGVVDILGIDDPVPTATDDSEIKALGVQVLGGGGNGDVFQGGDDEVAAVVGGKSSCHAEEGKVVALGSSGSEDDLVAVDPQERGEFVASVIHGLFGGSSYGVMAGGIAEVLREEG